MLERGIETDVVPALQQYGLGLLPFFPLASGLLTGKYHRGEAAPEGSRVKAWKIEGTLTDRKFDVLEAIESLATERGVTMLDVAMGGLAAQPTVSSVIAGATSPAQVRANVAACEWAPTADDLGELNRITSA